MTDNPWPENDSPGTPFTGTAAYGPGSATIPVEADSFVIWTTVSAALFIIAGIVTLNNSFEVETAQDVAECVISSVLCAAGFVGVILSRIGSQIRRVRISG